MRQKIVIILLIVLVGSSVPIYAQENKTITINLDGENIVFNKEYGEPFVDENSRTQVPFRIVLESFGAEVNWDNEKRIAIARKDDITVYAPIGEDYIFKNEEKILNDTKSQVRNERTYLPIRIVMESFGCKVEWDQASYTVSIVSKVEQVDEKVELPVKYDLRDFKRTTSIKNQGVIGACWAFAALSAIESTLLPDEYYDFSEDNLSLNHGFDLKQNEGGHYRIALAYLARWAGPVLEKEDIYGDGLTNPEAIVVKHVQEAMMIQNKDMDKIKEMVMEYGAVQTSIYSPILINEDIKDLYYNEKTFSLYNYGENESNHDINIVGWDDEYPKEKFLVEPKGNGAFICKNSWGDEFGEDGYYYISYYDNNIAQDNIVYTKVENTNNYDNIYQYDTLGWVRSVGYNEKPVYFSNVYTAKDDEILKAASFYATGMNTSYDVYVINDFKGEFENIENLQPVASGIKEVTGYYTVDFEEEIKVAKDEKFAVVVKIQTPNSETPIAIETVKEDLYVSEVVVNEGESYISPDGITWDDLGASKDIKSNVCLKVFTNKQIKIEEDETIDGTLEENNTVEEKNVMEEINTIEEDKTVEEKNVIEEINTIEEDKTVDGKNILKEDTDELV